MHVCKSFFLNIPRVKACFINKNSREIPLTKNVRDLETYFEFVRIS